MTEQSNVKEIISKLDKTLIDRACKSRGQAELKRIFKSPGTLDVPSIRHEYIREVALSYIEDESFMKEVIARGEAVRYRKIAASKLTEKKSKLALKSIALHDKSPEVRIAAIHNITSKRFLRRLEKDNNSHVASAAKRRLAKLAKS